MIKDKRIEWCQKYCVDVNGNSYIEKLSFDNLDFIIIETERRDYFALEFNENELPDFIKFKVKSQSIKRVNIDLKKCPNLKSWKGLPIDNMGSVWLGNELENIDSMPMCDSIDHEFIKNKQEKNIANKKLRIKQWQKFKSEVLEKLQEQNPNINILDYQDGIEWLAIHEVYFYNNILEENIVFSDHKIILNGWTVFESIVNVPSIKIQLNSNVFSELYIDDFNYSNGNELMNNISGNKKIFLPNKKNWISENDFLMISEEKTKQNIIESKMINRKYPKNK